AGAQRRREDVRPCAPAQGYDKNQRAPPHFSFARVQPPTKLAPTMSASPRFTNPLPVETEPVFPLEPHEVGGIGGHPAGLTTLFLAEMWERFSYYGMRALLILFMTKTAVEGGLGFDDKKAAGIYGTYTMSVYLMTILGGFIADNFIGSRRAVLIGGIIIATGHFS